MCSLYLVFLLTFIYIIVCACLMLWIQKETKEQEKRWERKQKDELLYCRHSFWA